MKSNDALLQYMISVYDMPKKKAASLVTDMIIHNPKQLKVPPNEVVYLHFFHSNCPNFSIEILTATQTLILDRNNTLNQSNNTILRAVSDIHFKVKKGTADFFVQLLRIHY